MRKLPESVDVSNKTKAKLRRHQARFQNGELNQAMIFMQSLHGVTKSLSQDHGGLSVCTKGCSHCCKLNVDLTLVEASYIAQRMKVDGVEFGYQQGFTPDTYCPFHNAVTKACQIYEFRPIACQLFASMDSVEFCKTPDVPHKVMTQFSIGTAFVQLVEPIEA
ncbi:MAG: YkgJ family cysteine cluster protein, partial [Shewanella sp.]